MVTFYFVNYKCSKTQADGKFSNIERGVISGKKKQQLEIKLGLKPRSFEL